MKKIAVFLLIFALTFLYSALYVSAEINYARPISQMTPQEKIAELRIATELTEEGKYYSQNRISQLNDSLMEDQKKMLDDYKTKVQKDLKRIEEYEKKKKEIIDKIKQKGEKYYEEHEEEINKEVEKKVKEVLSISDSDWDSLKDKVNMGKDYYEQEVAGHVETVQKLYDTYQEYQKAKEHIKEAPDEAKELLGALNLMGKGLDEIAGKLDDSQIGKAVAPLFRFYSEATKLGNKAADNAWKYVHRDGISSMHNTQYSEAFEEFNRKTGIMVSEHLEKAPLMNHDDKMKILDNGNEYIVFGDNYEYVGTLSEEEYRKMEMLYTGFRKLKDEATRYSKVNGDWKDLTSEQLLKLSKGEEVEVVTNDRWFRADETTKITANDLLEEISSNIDSNADDTGRESVYHSLYGDIDDDPEAGGFLDGIKGIFGRDTKSKRIKEIEEAFKLYRDSLPIEELMDDRNGYRFYSDGHHWENFLTYALSNKNNGKSVNDLIKELKEKKDVEVEGDSDNEDVPEEIVKDSDAYEPDDSINMLPTDDYDITDIMSTLSYYWEMLYGDIQTYPLRGSVIDPESEEPIAGAHIAIHSEYRSSPTITTTDSSGQFSVGEYLLKERLTVKADAKGYHPSTRGGSLKSENTRVIIRLKKDPEEEAEEDEDENVKIKNSILILIDVSGSMSGDKLLNAISSAQNTVGGLGKHDEVAIMSFSGCGNSTKVVVPFTQTKDDNKESIIDRISGLSAGGDTAIAIATRYAGYYLHSKARSSNKSLIILSDGVETCNGNPASSIRSLN